MRNAGLEDQNLIATHYLYSPRKHIVYSFPSNPRLTQVHNDKIKVNSETCENLICGKAVIYVGTTI